MLQSAAAYFQIFGTHCKRAWVRTQERRVVVNHLKSKGSDCNQLTVQKRFRDVTFAVYLLSTFGALKRFTRSL